VKPPDPNENGGLSAAAIANPAKDVDVLGESVKALRMTRWLDMAIVMHRMGATDPAEYQRLGIWLHRMRRAVG
jgi:hypothetical protein